ncbi:MAG: hypothetical protein AB7K52_11700 [Phycisphaerales bacterium]
MNQTLEGRLDALGRQAVSDALAPVPAALVSAVSQRQVARSTLRLTLACAGIGCFLLTGLLAYVMLPVTPRPVGSAPGTTHAAATADHAGAAGEPPASHAGAGDSGQPIHAAGGGSNSAVSEPGATDKRAPVAAEVKPAKPARSD